MRRTLLAVTFVAFLLLWILPVFAQTNQTVTAGSATSAANFTSGGCEYSWVNSNPAIGLPASGSGNISSFTATNTTGSPITATITATPYVGGYAYISHYYNGTVSVINTANSELITTITVGSGPFGVSVSPDGSKVYVTNRNDNTVSVINTLTNTVIATIPVGKFPWAACFTPNGKYAYVTNSQDNTVTVIDNTTNSVVTTINVDTSPIGVTVSPDGSTVYVSCNYHGTVSVISTATNSVVSTIQAGEYINGVVISPDGSKLYITDGFDALVDVIDVASGTVIAKITVGALSLGIAISPDGTRVYTTNQESNTVSVINTATNQVIATIASGSVPTGVSFSFDGKWAYVTNQGDGNVSIINTQTNALVSKISTDTYPISFGNFISPAAPCNGSVITFTITVNPNATSAAITASAATGTISACVGTASVSPNIQQFTVSGSNLSAAVTATAPIGFEVSLTPGSGYGNSVILNQTAGSLSNTTMYVRSAANDPDGPISGNVTLTSTGAPNQTVLVSGTVNPLPTVNTIPNQTVASGASTTAVNFTGTGNAFTWTNDTPSIGLAASGTGNISSFTAINTGSSPVTATVTAMAQSEQGFAYVGNSTDNTVSVINTATNTVIKTIAVGTGPSYVTFSPDQTKVYIANTTGNTISIINTQTNTVTATIAAGTTPGYMATSPDGSKLYVVNDPFNSTGSVTVVNTANNTIIGNIPSVAGTIPADILVSADGSRLYVENSVQNAPSTLSVYNTANNTLVATVPLGMTPTGIAMTPDGTRLYIANEYNNNVTVINTLTNTVITTVAVGSHPYGVAISSDGTRVYVSNNDANSVSVINTATNTVINTLLTPLYSSPTGVSVSSDGLFLYVVNLVDDNVSVFNTSTNAIITTVPVGQEPQSTGQFVSAGLSCPGIPTTFTITVNPTSTPATITTSAVTGTISACVGTASASPNVQQFTVSGSNLTADIMITPPTGFEASIDGIHYGTLIVLNHLSGTIGNTIIYVRSAANDAPGTISGNVMLISTGAASQSISVSGIVNPLPTVNTVPNQTVANGASTTVVSFTGTGNVFTWTNDTPSIGLAASGTGNITSFTAVNTGNTPVTATVTVTPQVNQGFAYIGNSNDNTISVINIATNSVALTLPSGNHPYYTAVTPDGSKAFILNLASDDITVINTHTNTVSATINTGVPLTAMTVSADGSKLYVANSGINAPGSILVINTATNAVVNTIKTAAGQPSGVILSPDGSRMYVINSTANATSGSNGPATLSVFNTGNNTILATIPLGLGPSGLDITNDGSRLYVANELSNNVTVINTQTNTVITTVNVGAYPFEVKISNDGNKVYVSNNNDNNISVISTATNTVIATIPTRPGGSPSGLSLSPNGLFLYVSNYVDNDVSVINTVTNNIVATIPVGNAPGTLGDFIIGNLSCPGTPTTFTITVNPAATPIITASPVTGDITGCEGALPATPRQFNVSATGLTAGLTVTAPNNFEVSLNATSGFVNILTIPETNGTVNTTTIYVRTVAGTPAGQSYQNVDLTSAGAQTQEVIVSYIIYAIPSVDAVINQSVVNPKATTAINFNRTPSTYNWVNNTPGIGLAASGTGNIPSFTAINNTNLPVIATITTTPLNSNGCSGTPIIFTITVYPTSLFSIVEGINPMTTIYGTPSQAQSFTVSAINVSGDVSVVAPAGFEVSLDNKVFTSTTTIKNNAVVGDIPLTSIYVRLAATTAVGNYTGNVSATLTTGGVGGDAFVPLSTVTPAPLTITANNITKPFNAVNPPLTVTYSGFVNNDGPAQLTEQPVVSTTALTQSPIGQYPITVSDAESPNYTITYVPGTLTIEPTLSAANIPNTFTPNGDGINDTWQINDLAYYPKSTVNIFDRWGQKVYNAIGYPIPWDGTYNGKILPSGTYYYIIDLKNGQKTLSGWVEIVK